MTSNKHKPSWKDIRIYIVSTVIIVLVVLITLALKKCWPFGVRSLMIGDFVGQTVPFTIELRRKLLNMDSMIYSWNAGFGTNFISILAYGMLSPVSLCFSLLSGASYTYGGTILYMILLVCANGSMLYYLTHRPVGALSGDNWINMLFSLAYTMCAYMVSFMDVWYYINCATLLPLVLLGMESYVYEKKWKLYVVSLALAFLSNYYLTGLFCVFIVLYYLTLPFNSFRHFIKTSIKILLLSAASLASTAVVMLPAVYELRKTSGTSSAYNGNVWFASFWNEIQYLFAFQKATFIGQGMTGYEYNHIYYGIMGLLLTLCYGFFKQIPLGNRIKKCFLLLVYLIAFDLNILNYIMHLGHYPNYYPNRFSIFFILLCIIMASEVWNVMEQLRFRHLSAVPFALVGGIGITLVICCYLFASSSLPQYVYYLTAILIAVYTLGFILVLFWKRLKYVLLIIGILELCINDIYMAINKDVYTEDMITKYAAMDALEIAEGLEESNGFSIMVFGDIFPEYNQGFAYGKKDFSLFSSSMTLAEDFFETLGFERTLNGIRSIDYNQAVYSLLNVEYQCVDYEDGYVGTSDYVYSESDTLFYDYQEIPTKDSMKLYRNPTVLGLGYMVDPEVQMLEFPGRDEDGHNVQIKPYLNQYVSTVGKCGDVLTETTDPEYSIESGDCVAYMNGSRWIMAEGQDVILGYDTFEDQNGVWCVPETMNAENDAYLAVTYTIPEDGYYFAETAGIISPMGYAKKDEPLKVYIRIERKQIQETGLVTGWLVLYRFDNEQWNQAYSYLAQQQLQVTSYDSTHVNGTIDVKEDGLLFTSIPYDDNWQLYVDGEEQEIIPLWNGTFLAAELSRGSHSIELIYRQRGLLAGSLITVFLLMLFMVGVIHDYKKKKKQDSHTEDSQSA